jgi:DNA-directed RNA polymerase beta' subunit
MPTEAQIRANKKAQLKKRQNEVSILLEKLGKVKICSKCGFEGDISLFRPGIPINYDKPTKQALKGTCKDCRRKSINQNNSCPIKKKRRAKKTYDWYCADPVRLEKKKERDIQYRSTEKGKKKQRERVDKIRTEQPHLIRWRKLLTHTLNRLGQPKENTTQELLRYSALELSNYLGNKPSKDAHIDHLIPVSWFIEITPANIVCDLRNLEWKDKVDNISKTNRYADEISLEYYETIKDYLKPEYVERMEIIGEKVVDKLSKPLTSVRT